jgi:IS30 family transposase
VLKKELAAHLRTRRVMRRSRHATITGQHRGQIVDAVSIRERPPQVEDRAVPGHWEGDLLEGSGGSAIATLVERTSRFTMLVKVQGNDTKGVTTALARQVRKLPAELRRSLTWDRGHEMAHHKAFTVATDRPLGAFPGSTEPDRPAPEPATTQDIGFQNAGRCTRGGIAMTG